MARPARVPAAAKQATTPDPESKTLQHLHLSSPSPSPLSPGLSDSSSVSAQSSPEPSITLSPPPVEQRNHAPGIPDRRKSVRPTSRSQSRVRTRDNRKSKASPISVSMANMSNVMKLRDDDEDETPGEKSVRRSQTEIVSTPLAQVLTLKPI